MLAMIFGTLEAEVSVAGVEIGGPAKNSPLHSTAGRSSGGYGVLKFRSGGLRTLGIYAFEV